MLGTIENYEKYLYVHLVRLMLTVAHMGMSGQASVVEFGADSSTKLLHQCCDESMFWVWFPEHRRDLNGNPKTGNSKNIVRI